MNEIILQAQLSLSPPFKRLARRFDEDPAKVVTSLDRVRPYFLVFVLDNGTIALVTNDDVLYQPL